MLFRGLTLIFAIFFSTKLYAQSGVHLQTTITEADAPAEWYVMQPGTDQFIAKSTTGWGFLATPPGRYEILIIPKGEGAVHARFPAISVAGTATTTFSLDSGLRLSSANDLTPLPLWTVETASSGTLVARSVDRWGLSLLPPGNYRIKARAGNKDRFLSVSVPPTGVVDVDISELGIGLVQLQDATTDIDLLFGGGGFETLLDYAGERFLLDAKNPDGWADLWLDSGAVSLTRRNGAFVDQHTFELAAGEHKKIGFDLPALAEARGYQTLDLGTSMGPVDRLTVTSMNGDRLLVSTMRPDLKRPMIAPQGARARLRIGETEEPVGWDGPVAQGGQVSLVVQSPENGDETTVNTQAVSVVGHASAVGSAGATRIAIVVDTSHSTADPGGIDLNGDGASESIFDLQIAAVRRLLKELHRIEGQSPGAAFNLALVEFGIAGSATIPFSRIERAADLERLEAAVGTMTIGGQGSDTFYDRGLAAAMRLLATEPDGPAAILLITDGKPSQPDAAVDAAARAGDSGIALHAIGLGPDFRGNTTQSVSYPSKLDNGAAILSLMASVGAPGGRSWALPNPGDIVDVVADLPVIERADAKITSVQMRNLDTGAEADDVALFPDGAFRGDVAIDTKRSANRIEVTAFGASGEASETVFVVSPGVDPAELQKAQSDSLTLGSQVSYLQTALAEKEFALSNAMASQAKLDGRVASLQTSAQGIEDQLDQCRLAQASCTVDLDRALAVAAAPEIVSPGVERITVPADILFEFGEATLSPAAADQLAIAAQYIRRTHPRSNIRLDGHTDGIGSAEDNVLLSEQRAQSVRDWLVRTGGLQKDRIAPRGIGEAQPVAKEQLEDGSDHPAGRQKNRRVEIYLER